MSLSPEVRKLLDAPEFAVLATHEPGGHAQLSVMWVGRDGDDVVLATKGSRRKVTNLRRDPRATVLVYPKTRPQSYVEIRGTVTITPEGASDLIDALSLAYTGAPHQRGSDAEEQDRVLIRLRPDHVVHLP